MAHGSASSACNAPEPLVLPVKNVSTTNEPIVKWGLGVEIGSPGQWIEAVPGPEWNNTSIGRELTNCGTHNDGSCSWYRGDYFDAEGSETWTEISKEDTYEFRPGGRTDLAISPWGTDNVTLSPSKTLPNFPLWALSIGYKRHNILGLGRDSSIINTLLKTKDIASNTWSVWWGWQGMEESQQMEGSLVLGGYDKAKMGGDDAESYAQNIIQSRGCPSGLLAHVKEIMVEHTGGGSTKLFGSAIQTMMSCIKPDFELITLPPDVHKKLKKAMLGTYVGPSKGIFAEGMSYDPEDVFIGNISFTFISGLTITIPSHQLVRPHTGINEDNEPYEIDANRTLMVSNSAVEKTPWLGQPFLSSAYLHVDHEQNEFKLWQAVPSKEQNLVSVDHASGPSTCEVGMSDGDDNGSSATSTPGQNDDEGSLSGGAIAGVVIGCVAGVAIIVALVFFLCRRKRVQNNRRAELGALPPKSDTKEAQLNELDSGQGHWRMSEMQAPEPPAMELPGDHYCPKPEG